MQIALRSGEGAVAENLLHVAQVGFILHQVGGAGVAERVRVEIAAARAVAGSRRDDSGGRTDRQAHVERLHPEDRPLRQRLLPLDQYR